MIPGPRIGSLDRSALYGSVTNFGAEIRPALGCVYLETFGTTSIITAYICRTDSKGLVSRTIRAKKRLVQLQVGDLS